MEDSDGRAGRALLGSSWREFCRDRFRSLGDCDGLWRHVCQLDPHEELQAVELTIILIFYDGEG